MKIFLSLLLTFIIIAIGSACAYYIPIGHGDKNPHGAHFRCTKCGHEQYRSGPPFYCTRCGHNNGG